MTTTLSLLQETYIKKVLTNLLLWTNNSLTIFNKASKDAHKRIYNKLDRQKDTVIISFQ